ncbi:MAG: sn-glycerol-1-phosphate dehydrogenase [Clostridia bacterium]|nr:sn-glycerol-1-phosphate dehydrogenase [Clostridia bacterium]
MHKPFDEMTLQELVTGGGYDCECGRHHACAMKYLNIGPGILNEVPEMLKAAGSRKPFILYDRNTYEAAGRSVLAILEGAGIPYSAWEIPERDGKRIAPAEWELGSCVFHFDPSCDLILGVGSGVINDLCKCLGKTAGLDTAIIGTAPSMDGYASDSGSMEVNGIKVSVYCKAPVAILLDTEILAQAPARMLVAGFGDMIAKYIAICEWRVSAMVTGEHYCEGIAGMMRAAVNRIMKAADGIPSRDPEAIRYIAEGLVISGIAMAYLGNSRPASGLEHYFSHVWEMMAMERHKPYDLHGIQVGIGTVLTLELYREIKKITLDRSALETAIQAFDEREWLENTRRIFGSCADEIVGITESAGLNSTEKRRAHFDILEKNWGEVLRIIAEELPEPDEIAAAARTTGMLTRPEEIGIGREDTVMAFIGSRNLRNKYLTSTLIWDLGLTERFAGLTGQ